MKVLILQGPAIAISLIKNCCICTIILASVIGAPLGSDPCDPENLKVAYHLRSIAKLQGFPEDSVRWIGELPEGSNCLDFVRCGLKAHVWLQDAQFEYLLDQHFQLQGELNISADARIIFQPEQNSGWLSGSDLKVGDIIVFRNLDGQPAHAGIVSTEGSHPRMMSKL